MPDSIAVNGELRQSRLVLVVLDCPYEILLGHGDDSTLSLLASGDRRPGPNTSDEHCHALALDPGRPLLRLSVCRQLKPFLGQIEDHKIGNRLAVVDGVLNRLPEPLGEVALAVTCSVEELDLAYERVVALDIGDDVCFA